MKPLGPLPPEFAHQTGVLHIGGRDARDWAAAHGTPLFIYDPEIAATRVCRFRAAFPGVALHYAVKANPFAPLVSLLAELVDGLDVASAGELALAAPLGVPVSFAGPGKRDAELAAAIAAGATINLESEGEAARVLTIADQAGVRPKLAVRVNPAFELRGSGMRMGGRASPFGIDAERVPVLVRHLLDAGADWRGFHVYAGSQSLDTAAVIESQAATVALAADLAERAGAAPPLVNLGGGFGVPHFAGDTPLCIGSIGEALADTLARRSAILAGTGFALELGRWLVAECGVYLARVIDRKESRGEVFLVLDGGLHHQLAATGNLGQVVRRNYPVAIATRMGEPPAETASIVGPLCTPLDRLADRAPLPRAEVGDLVAVFLAGAYGLSASPTGFLGHPLPAEVLARSP